eukprot:273828-Chlamydomonas_euryale.AAC.3
MRTHKRPPLSYAQVHTHTPHLPDAVLAQVDRRARGREREALHHVCRAFVAQVLCRQVHARHVAKPVGKVVQPRLRVTLQPLVLQALQMPGGVGAGKRCGSVRVHAFGVCEGAGKRCGSM